MMREKKVKKQSKKAPISPVLKSLDLYKTVTFPLARMSSVRTTVQIIQCESVLEFCTRKNKETKELEVTRTK